jgi:uncharacterized protein YprB with RNaseH-like and TPR domain
MFQSTKFDVLYNTFVHLSGIGAIRERELWKRGIFDWDQFLEAASEGQLRGRAYQDAIPAVEQSLDALDTHNIGFFKAMLPDQEIWRVYTQFASDALFLDIETTGLAAADHEVTLIATCNRYGRALFVNGINLDAFPAYAAQFPLLVTFNGCQFDLPFLRAHFPNAPLDQTHIDLRFVLASLGYQGGLKTLEHAFGIRRDVAIQGLTGSEAVRLWCRYRHGDRAALKTLALYNLTDAAHLAVLMTIAVELKTRQLKFPGHLTVCENPSPIKSGQEFLADWFVQHRDF